MQEFLGELIFTSHIYIPTSSFTWENSKGMAPNVWVWTPIRPPFPSIDSAGKAHDTEPGTQLLNCWKLFKYNLLTATEICFWMSPGWRAVTSRLQSETGQFFPISSMLTVDSWSKLKVLQVPGLLSGPIYKNNKLSPSVFSALFPELQTRHPVTARRTDVCRLCPFLPWCRFAQTCVFKWESWGNSSGFKFPSLRKAIRPLLP